MKIILFGLLSVSCLGFAKEVKDFNKVLILNVQKDIQNDNVQSFKKRAVGRMPASVNVPAAEGKNIQEDQKFDKMNNRQIGPNKW